MVRSHSGLGISNHINFIDDYNRKADNRKQKLTRQLAIVGVLKNLLDENKRISGFISDYANYRKRTDNELSNLRKIINKLKNSKKDSSVDIHSYVNRHHGQHSKFHTNDDFINNTNDKKTNKRTSTGYTYNNNLPSNSEHRTYVQEEKNYNEKNQTNQNSNIEKTNNNNNNNNSEEEIESDDEW